MGADFLLSSLVIDKGCKPDFDAGHRAIERLCRDQIEIVEEFDADPGTDDGMAAIRRAAAEALDELECGLLSREVEWIEVRGATVYVTGGMSCGQAPTELFTTISRLRVLSGVLAAVGFEGEA